jgi:hypothetical protein
MFQIYLAEDKFLVLHCLMNQILSYATVRDIIEEKLDELRNTKQALRMLTVRNQFHRIVIVIQLAFPLTL